MLSLRSQRVDAATLTQTKRAVRPPEKDLTQCVGSFYASILIFCRSVESAVHAIHGQGILSTLRGVENAHAAFAKRTWEVEQ